MKIATKKLPREFFGGTVPKYLLNSTVIKDTVLDIECTAVKGNCFTVYFPGFDRIITINENFFMISTIFSILNRLAASTSAYEYEIRIIDDYKLAVANEIFSAAESAIRTRLPGTVRGVVSCNGLLAVNEIMVPYDAYYGDRAMFKRDPILDKYSLAYVSVKGWEHKSIGVNPRLWKSMKGDFDGDTGTLLYCQDIDPSRTIQQVSDYESSITNDTYESDSEDLPITLGVGLIKVMTGQIIGLANSLLAIIDNMNNRQLMDECSCLVKGKLGQAVLDLKHGLKGRKGRTEINYYKLVAFKNLLQRGSKTITLNGTKYSINNIIHEFCADYPLLRTFLLLNFAKNPCKLSTYVEKYAPGYYALRHKSILHLMNVEGKTGSVESLIYNMIGDEDDKNIAIQYLESQSEPSTQDEREWEED